MALPLTVESAPYVPEQQLDVAQPRPTLKQHGVVRVPGLSEDIDWTLEIPEEGLTYDGLVLLLPGYGCVKRHSRGERHANAAAGEATISYDPGRLSGSLLENMARPQDLHTAVASSVLTDVQRLFKGRPVLPGQTAIDASKVTLSPHSMGGFAGISLALQRTGEIDAVISKATVGYGSPSWKAPYQLDLAHTGLEIVDYIRHERPDNLLQHAWKSAYYFGRSPSRSLGEALACLTRQNIEAAVALSSKGVPTGYLAFGDDGLVPFEPIRSTVNKVVDRVMVLDGYGHLAPQRFPLETAAAVRGLRKCLRP